MENPFVAVLVWVGAFFYSCCRSGKGRAWWQCSTFFQCPVWQQCQQLLPWSNSKAWFYKLLL